MALDIKKNVPLAQYTTLHIGGVADYVVEVTSKDELKEACAFAKEKDIPLLTLGGGSNVLISDDGFRGLVIIMSLKGRDYDEVDSDTVRARFGAGEVLDGVVADAAARTLWGLENLSSIPGSVGATPVQNVGAYGVEVSKLIFSVETIHKNTNEEKIFSNDECNFLYRDSFFKSEEGKEFIITAVAFTLSKIPQPQVMYGDLSALREAVDLTPAMVRETVATIRAHKFPDWTQVGTAGSFFKNPVVSAEQYSELKQHYTDIPGYVQSDGTVKISLGYVLDKVCGLRGYCEGNVCLYEKQALVLVTKKAATAAEVKNFTHHIKEKVFQKTKIEIECEVLFI